MNDTNNYSERELLLIMHTELRALSTQVSSLQGDIRADQKTNSERFQGLELFRQSMSNAVAATEMKASAAERKAKEAAEAADALKDELDRYKAQFRVLVIVGTPVIALISTIINHYLGQLLP